MLWWNLRQLKSSNAQIRRRGVKGLGQTHDPRALSALLAALTDESYLVRKEAARALGDIGDARSVRPLLGLIEESSHYGMARVAVSALELVLGRDVVSAVAEDVQAVALLDDVSGTTHNRRVGLAWFSEAAQSKPWSMDCSRVRKLAYRELTRRGLAA